MTCRGYADSLLRQGWKAVNLDGDNLTLAKDGQLRTIDLRFDTSAKYPSSAAQVADGGTYAWTNISYILAADSTYATCGMASNGWSYRLIACNFGFAIPTAAVINGISVSVLGYAEVANKLDMPNGSLGNWNGSAFTTKGNGGGTGYWIASPHLYTLGSSSDLWGATWTPANINASAFGFGFYGRNGDTVYRTMFVDAVEITVTYIIPVFGGAFLLRMI